MTEINVRTIAGVTTRYLPNGQVALTGRQVDVERALMGLRVTDRLAGQPSEMVETGFDGRVTVTVQLREPAPHADVKPRIHPGWIVAILAAATAAILAAAVLLFVVLSAIVAATSLIVGVCAVFALIAVAPKLFGGGSHGTWKTN